MEVLVIITTESSNANALRMAKLLIQNKLAACVSIKQIFSIFKWEDDIEETKEFEITIKSKLCLLYTSPSPRDRTRSRMPSSA